MKCDYCPYIVLDNSTRLRSPEAVAEEMRQDIRHWGFRSFKFRDPLFGLHRSQVAGLAEQIGRLPRKIQFSIETRTDLLPPETLRLLRSVGLTSITVGMERPDADISRHHHRPLIADDRQREFILLCRSLGIRTVAGFLLGFPDDTEESIQRRAPVRPVAESHLCQLQRGYALSGHGLFPADAAADRRHRLRPLHGLHAAAEVRASHARGRMEQLVAKCFHRFYFRWQYLRENAPLLWPALRRLGLGPRPAGTVPLTQPSVPRPLAAGEVLHAQGSPLRRPALAGHGPRRIGRPPRGRGGSGGIIVFIHSVTSRTITAKAGRSIRNVSEAGRRPARAPVAPKTPRS